MRIEKNARPARTRLRILCGGLVTAAAWAIAQEPSEPLPSPSIVETVSPTPSPPPTPARSVRISFIPPPLEGTISLGIFDTNGKLVRVLHQQAAFDVFTVGADALQTKWDGKDDDGTDLPPGKYQARGYTVGRLHLENLSFSAVAPPTPVTGKITIKLMANPLVKNDRPSVELAVGADDTDSFIKTSDELPLYVISERSGITNVAFAKNGEKSIDVWQNSSAGSEHFRISNLDQMMAFDCGSFELK